MGILVKKKKRVLTVNAWVRIAISLSSFTMKTMETGRTDAQRTGRPIDTSSVVSAWILSTSSNWNFAMFSMVT